MKPGNQGSNRQLATKELRKFRGANTRDSRIAIDDDEFSWIENVIPIGDGDLRVVPASSGIKTTLTGESIYYWTDANIGGTDYVICICASGAAYAVNLATYAGTKFAVAGTFSAAGAVACQWKNERVLIIDPSKGYFSWDGTQLCGNGSVTVITVTAGGTGYNSTPTVSFYGGGGISATASLSGNAVNNVSVNTGGTGYATPPTVVFTGGGGSGAAAHCTLSGGTVNGIVVDNGGSGYTSPPTVSFYDGGSSSPNQGGGSPTATASFSATSGAVTTISVTAPGQTFTSAPTVVISGGNGSGATATAALMAGPSQGTTIASYAGHVWIGYGRIVQFTDTGSYYSLGGVGGAFTIADSTLASTIQSMLPANGFLYIFGVSSINAIGDVRVSSGVVLFSNTNLTAQVGTNIPAAITVKERSIWFLNRYGIYALRGANPREMSEELDGMFGNIDFTKPVTAGVALIYNNTCASFLVTYNDPVSGPRPLILLNIQHGNERGLWFFCSQGSSLQMITGVIVAGVPKAIATDGSNIYELFSDTSTAVSTTIKTKLWDMNDPVSDKMAMRAGIAATVPAQTTLINVSIDNELGYTNPYSLSANSAVTWVNNSGQSVTWINNSSNPVNWISQGYSFMKSDVSGVGKFLGMTLTSTVPQLNFNAFYLESQNGARW